MLPGRSLLKLDYLNLQTPQRLSYGAIEGCNAESNGKQNQQGDGNWFN